MTHFLSDRFLLFEGSARLLFAFAHQEGGPDEHCEAGHGLSIATVEMILVVRHHPQGAELLSIADREGHEQDFGSRDCAPIQS